MKILTRLPFSHSPMAWPMSICFLLLMAFSNVSPLKGINPVAGKADADIKVLGTSNLHNWSMEDKVVSCIANFTYGAGKVAPRGLDAFAFSFPVHSLTSGKSGMDSKAYDAMLTAACTVKPDGSVSCTGTSKLLMSDYHRFYN